MRRYHHVMGQGLRQFDLLGAICAAFNMLNTNESAHFSQHKHRDCEEPLAPFLHQVFSKVCPDARVMFDIVAHHRALGEEHLLNLQALLPCISVLNEWMVWLRCNLMITFNRNADQMRRQLDQLEIFRGRTSWFPIVEAKSSQNPSFEGEDWIRPRGS